MNEHLHPMFKGILNTSEGGAETNTPELLSRVVDHFYEYRDDIFRKYTEE